MNEKRIADLMKKLEITREEALEMLAEDEAIDHGADPHPLTEEQEKVAKAMRKADRTPTVYKFTKRERKPNELKREIIKAIFDFIVGNWNEIENTNITNIERQIDFDLGGESFSLTLTQHRKKKG